MGKHNGSYAGAVVLGGAGPRPPDFLGFGLTNTAAQFTQNLTNSWVLISGLNLNTNNLSGNTVTITAWIYPIGSQADSVGLFFNLPLAVPEHNGCRFELRQRGFRQRSNAGLHLEQ